MLFPKQFLILFAAIAEISYYGQAKLFYLDRILLTLQKLKQVVNYTLLADLYFVCFLKKRSIRESFQTFVSSLHITCV